uniref:V-SNARE coiled-coil homology domain-containing protein n=1 Tax=Macrostomum lignano TaxID=282301 RepID=A0A1I8IDN3_9PLAT
MDFVKVGKSGKSLSLTRKSNIDGYKDICIIKDIERRGAAVKQLADNASRMRTTSAQFNDLAEKLAQKHKAKDRKLCTLL